MGTTVPGSTSSWFIQSSGWSSGATLGILWLVGAIVVLVTAATVHVRWRRERIDSFRNRAHETLEVSEESWRAAGHASARHDDGYIFAAAASGTTAASFLWEWSTIDPAVVRAADFAFRDQVDNGFDFINLVWDRYRDLAENSATGWANRFYGYVAEQHAHEKLVEAGHVVVEATLANQPIWDFLVDGAQVNIKAYADLSNLDPSDPDTTYLVPEDARGVLDHNVEFLEGWSGETSRSVTMEALTDATGESVVDGLMDQIPMAAVAVATFRQVGRVRRGKTMASAVEHGAIDAGARGLSAAVGAQAGAAVGAVAGPAGMVVGGILGAAGASFAAGPTVKWAKRRRVRSAERQVVAALGTYGLHALPYRMELGAWACGPVLRAEETLEELSLKATRVRRTPRWWVAPTLPQVALQEAVKVGAVDIEREWEAVAPALEVIHSATEEWPTDLGALLYALPEAAVAAGCADLDLHDEIEGAHNDLQIERKNLQL